ncbi:MAG: DUF3362 domain-containing protein, partial [Deltaproteobacteria bacterium]|nr:DUF3362 domain-containing protein [Deltaproteobacteria bacterium]
SFETFAEKFERASVKAGKEQYLVPYYIASHPGSGVAEMIELALFLKAHGYKPRQVQDFIPAPMDIATCMYWTGLDPQTLEPVSTVTKLGDRKIQKALIQFFKPENWFAVHKALTEAGRSDLIGGGPQCLIPQNPPHEAVDARRREARESTYVHAKDAGTSETAASGPGAAGERKSADDGTRGKPRDGVGYRPGRAGHRRRGPG